MFIGWWLAKNSQGNEGWAPSAYLKEEAPPPPPVVRQVPPPPPPAAPAKSNGVNGAAARAKPAPPPPAKRPAVGRKPVNPSAPRDSGMSLASSYGNGGESGRSTPTPSLAGGLAEALRARQSAMQKDKEDDDDW